MSGETTAPKRSCNLCCGGKKVWSDIISSYDICPDCGGSGVARLKYLGPVVSDFTFEGGRVGRVRIELWRHPDGERQFGKVLEVLS